jgi:hypothetical protein
MVANVFDHAYHLGPGGLEAAVAEMLGLEFLAEGALSGPGGTCERFVDDHDAVSRGAILLLEVAAFEESRFHGAQITDRDGAVIGEERSRLILAHALGPVGAVPVGIVVEREVGNRTDGFDAGNRRELLFPILHELRARDIVAVALEGKIDFEGEEPLGFEAGADLAGSFRRCES